MGPKRPPAPVGADLDPRDPAIAAERHAAQLGGLPYFERLFEIVAGDLRRIGGCFWCMQPPFDHVPGVTATRVGFTGGREANPTYKQVSAGDTGHREAIEVTFDPTNVPYTKLLEVFWQNINPIQRDGQFHDVGDQYTSAIFYRDGRAEKSRRGIERDPR